MNFEELDIKHIILRWKGEAGNLKKNCKEQYNAQWPWMS